MDPEANSVLDTSSGDAATNTTPVASNDNSPSSEPRLVSQGPKYKSKNWEGIEEQKWRIGETSDGTPLELRGIRCQ